MLDTIQLGAHVENENGEQFGSVKNLIIEQFTNEVTHLVVEKSILFNTTQKVLPANAVQAITDEGKRVHINLTKSQYEHLDDFETREYVQVQHGHGAHLAESQTLHMGDSSYLYPVAGSGVLMPGLDRVAPMNIGTGAADSAYTLKTNIPDNSLVLKAGADVEATDGRIGKIKKVKLDPTSHKIAGFVIEEGGFFDEDYAVPLELVESITDNLVRLNVAKENLPTPTAIEQPDSGLES